MDQFPTGFEFDRERLRQAARRWAGVITAAALLAGLVAFGVSKVVPPEYEASAQLYLAPASNPTIALQDVLVGQSLARSYVQLATAEVVLRPAMETVGWSGDFTSFRNRVQVSQVRDTSVIAISFRLGDAGAASDTANAIVDSFIARSHELRASVQGSAASNLEQQIASLQDDIRSLDGQILTLRLQIAASPKPGESPAAKAELQNQMLQLDNSRQTKQQTLALLLKTRDDMRLAQAREETTVSLWQPATPPDAPISPKPLLNTLLGAVAGGLVAICAVALVSYLDDRLTDLEQVRYRLAQIPLGQVRLRRDAATLGGKLFVRDEGTSPEAEAIRGIRTNILFAGADHRPHTILVTSALPGEGKSVLSANLALAFAEAGLRVVLIDADLRRPAQHRLFRFSASTGLTSLLAEPSGASQVEQFRRSANLVIVPSGPLPPNPAEMLGSARMSTLLQQLDTKPDTTVVILDSSPVLAVADPVALATKVDAVIVVVDSSQTRVAAVRRALAALQRVHAPIIGVVLNKLSEAEAAYYRYTGYYEAQHPPRPSKATGVRTD